MIVLGLKEKALLFVAACSSNDYIFHAQSLTENLFNPLLLFINLIVCTNVQRKLLRSCTVKLPLPYWERFGSKQGVSQETFVCYAKTLQEISVFYGKHTRVAIKGRKRADERLWSGTVQYV